MSEMNEMSNEFKIFKCCPYCKSGNIKEETLKYLPEMDYHFYEYQLGTCLDCGESWNDL